MTNERRKASVRRDLNDLVRDESGKVSLAKCGSLAGAFIACKILLTHSAALIERWDSMGILMLLLIAPEVLKKFLLLKYTASVQTVTTTEPAPPPSKKTVTVTEPAQKD